MIESFSEFFRKNNGVGGPWLITGLCVPPRKRSAAAKQGFAVLAIGDMAARDRLFGFDLWTGNRAASSDLVVCGDYEGWEAEVGRVFVDNLGRFVRGEPLRNRVDKSLGYPTDR